MDLSNKIVRIASQTIEYDWEKPFIIKEMKPSIGSGFFIDKNGHILTCSHVVDNAKKVYILIPSEGKDKFECDVKGICPKLDLAILKIKNYKNKDYFQLGDSNKIKFGQDSMAIGYPLGQNNLKITKGIISGKEDGLFQTDTPINPGNSGGPLVIKNKVIGINTSGILDASNVGYATPINQYKLISDELKKGNRSIIYRPKLGISYNYTNSNFLDVLDSKCKNGIYINNINHKSPIYKSGLEVGDILCSINGIKIDDYGMLNKNWFKDKMTLDEILLTIKTNSNINIEYSKNNKFIKKNFKFEKFKLGVRYEYPIYEKVDYYIFSGLILMNLTRNHLCNKNLKIKLNKFNNPINRENPVLIVTDIIPNSFMHIQDVFNPGDIIIKINNHQVDNIESLKKYIKKPIIKNKKRYLSIEGNNGKKVIIKESELDHNTI